MGPDATAPVVLFDGVCALCTASVRFLLRRDAAGSLRFASLQSPAGRRIVEAHGLDPDALDSIVLVERGRAWRESSAALRTTRRLPLPWRLLMVGLVVPRPLRDAAYRWVARHRYRWFGRTEQCWVPTPELSARFLER